MKDILWLGVGGLAIYLVYNWLTTPTPIASTAATSSGSTSTSAAVNSSGAPVTSPATPAVPVTPPAVAAVQYTSPTLSAQLAQVASAAGEPNSLNADQWNYYLAQVSGQKALQDPTYSKIFWPSGRPASMSSAPLMTAAAFVAAAVAGGALGSGLSGFRGFGQVRRPVAPVGFLPRNYVRPGTPMRRLGA